MKSLRTVSTQRLLAMIAGLVIAIAGGTAIAVAASGSGPVPAPKPLARAIHDALGGQSVNGISARITFTNHLISSTNIQGSDPILTGATGRLWLSNNHQLRLELQSDNGDAQIVVNNGSFWVYDPTANTVYEGKLPAGTGAANKHDATTAKKDTLPSVAQIQTDLNKALQHTVLSGAIPSDVAGQPTYTVRVTPKHDGGLLGAAELAWDSVHGLPLRVAVYARGDSTPVLELKATNISYGAVAASNFNISPPAGAKVVKVSTPGAGGSASKAEKTKKHGRKEAQVSGAAAVARHLPFALVAPKTLVGVPRQSVSLLDWGGSPAALVTYGQNLGGIAVIEQTAHAKSASSGSSSADSGSSHSSLSLPTVSINGATGQELDTALGTMVRFTRAGVSYTVIGSVPAAAAEAAARAL
jgi:outer membrane lipoprotein-sorting protein